MALQAGVARTCISPFWGVELTGWGYYIQRRWQKVRDDLQATALVVTSDAADPSQWAVVVALDMMVIDECFANNTRTLIHAATGIPPSAVLLTCSHSHNTPAAGGLRGVGECDPLYEAWASRQAATAAILAWQNLQPAVLSWAHTEVQGISYNRTRANGTVDPNLTTLRVDTVQGDPLAVVVNYQAHPCVYTELYPHHVSRDVPGEVCDRLELALLGAIALYIQGACGDVNLLREFSTEARCQEPARRIAEAALASLQNRTVMEDPQVAAASKTAAIPTRRWTAAEIAADRDEATRRLANNDISYWRETIGRSMTNRPDDMVARHGGNEHAAVMAMVRFHLEWTQEMLLTGQQRSELLFTEVQALRLGDLYLAANATEFFSNFALDVRRRAGVAAMMVACYANGRIGYMPDAHDIERKTYAAYQSPKYCNQFPFTEASGPAMCDSMLECLSACQSAS